MFATAQQVEHVQMSMHRRPAASPRSDGRQPSTGRPAKTGEVLGQSLPSVTTRFHTRLPTYTTPFSSSEAQTRCNTITDYCQAPPASTDQRVRAGGRCCDALYSLYSTYANASRQPASAFCYHTDTHLAVPGRSHEHHKDQERGTCYRLERPSIAWRVRSEKRFSCPV